MFLAQNGKFYRTYASAQAFGGGADDHQPVDNGQAYELNEEDGSFHYVSEDQPVHREEAPGQTESESIEPDLENA